MENSGFLTISAILVLSVSLVQGNCPEGLSNINYFAEEALPFVCSETCSFRTGYFGIPSGTRTRTVFTCCNGEVPEKVKFKFNTYTCSPSEATVLSSSSVQPETTTSSSPSVRPETTTSSSPSVRPETTTSSSPSVRPETTTSSSPSVQPETTTSSSSSVQPETTSSSPSVRPETTTPQEAAISSSASVQPESSSIRSGCPIPRFTSQFRTQTNVCQFRCEFRVGAQTQIIGTRVNTRYGCCDESTPKTVRNGPYRIYSCE